MKTIHFSRRQFLAWYGALPILSQPGEAFAQAAPHRKLIADSPSSTHFSHSVEPQTTEALFKPHYRSPSPLQNILEKVDPAKDIFPSEVAAADLNRILLTWRKALMSPKPDWNVFANSFAARFKGCALTPAQRAIRRHDAALQILDLTFNPALVLSGSDFLNALSTHFRDAQFLWAEFKITAIDQAAGVTKAHIRYDLVDTAAGYHRQQRVGWIDLTWTQSVAGTWKVTEWRLLNETCSRSLAPLFEEITKKTLGENASFREQLARGTDYWRTVLDGACGIDIYGNFGVAAGDIDNDGWDDLYVCQPSGLPNRLYHNRGDGTFEDVTDRAGVGVIDSSPSALFADVDNDGHQDLIVVRGTGPLLFLNQGDGTFRLKQDAFHFAQKARGTFTGAALADYDRDGWLDIYFCLYSYYQGPDRYKYPVPYDDAENGPPNFFFRNNRDGTFTDVTRQTHLDRNNNRFSFACGWCDYDGDGWPDLYVANDFGKKNLYHNNGDGTFTDVAQEAGVIDTGAGMSVCWLDYDNDGKQDLYVADMWTAAGLRLTHLNRFMPNAPENVRSLYQKHAMGNSLFHNKGKFQNATAASGSGMGRWAWSSDAWDFDHDGFPDIYIANGMISGPNTAELSSFFWRQVVARSPLGNIPTDSYQQGWNAINELIRSDGTWSGYERNVLYSNNRDGTFSEVSGAAGLDLIDDSRSFALADIDHDGRLEIILKNRTAPQVRIFHNVMSNLGHSLSFKLKGHNSNRDAIGTAITVRATSGRQTKFLQAGSGFLAQHAKEVFFGVGPSSEPVHVTLRWPNGLSEEFENVPADHRIEIEEGAGRFKAVPYAIGPATKLENATDVVPSNHQERENFAQMLNYREELPRAFETWLVAPIDPPEFSLPDFSGSLHRLSNYRGQCVMLQFCSLASPSSARDLRLLQDNLAQQRGIAVLAVNINLPPNAARVAALVKQEALRFPVLMAAEETLSIYNLLYRYSFDRRRDLTFPISFLLDPEGMMVKIYHGPLDANRALSDAGKIPKTGRARQQLALPFRGDYYGGSFIRNYFTYGVTFAQHGYPEAAETAFKRAIQNEPQSADAYYDLGTLYMQQQKWDQAREQLLKAAQLEPDDLMALNNLGVIAAREGRAADAAAYLTRVLQSDPGNVLALGNLADLRRSQGQFAQAERLLESALKSQPDNPELNYKLGMVFASAGGNVEAQKYLEKAIQLQPDYAEALDNLGVLYALTNQPTRAIAAFNECIERAPKFDQAYLNLARVQIKLGNRTGAAAVLRELLKEIPGHPLAEKYLQALGQ